MIGVPLTVMVSPAAKPGDSEFGAAVARQGGRAVIGAGGAAWLLATLPVATLAVLKKLSPASTADAATSDVLASVLIDAVQGGVQIASAVAVGVAPIVKLPVGGGVRVGRRQLDGLRWCRRAG